jgi:hypothetical protein
MPLGVNRGKERADLQHKPEQPRRGRGPAQGAPGAVLARGGPPGSAPFTIPNFVWRELRRRRRVAEQPEEQPEDLRSAVRRARAGITGRRGG